MEQLEACNWQANDGPMAAQLLTDPKLIGEGSRVEGGVGWGGENLLAVSISSLHSGLGPSHTKSLLEDEVKVTAINVLCLLQLALKVEPFRAGVLRRSCGSDSTLNLNKSKMNED